MAREVWTGLECPVELHLSEPLLGLPILDFHSGFEKVARYTATELFKE